MSTAPDPAAFAASNGLNYANNAVQVVIELDSKEAELPRDFSIAVETRSGELVQAMVAVADLCPLSNQPQVKSIRAPFQAVPSKR